MAELVDFLRTSRVGVYAVEAGGHCFAVNCTTGEIIDSDPINPAPLPLTITNLKRMGYSVRGSLSAYEVIPLSRRTKSRKRQIKF